jgi:hypothetical protein
MTEIGIAEFSDNKEAMIYRKQIAACILESEN